MSFLGVSCRACGRYIGATKLMLKSSVIFTQNRDAGHSHWQNVRHIKEAKDKEKARITSVLLMQLNIAIKAGGGSKDPKLNSRVAAVLADAKANNIPLETLTRRLIAKDITDSYVIEIQAPGGIFSLIETRAKAVKPTRDKVQGIAKKYGFKVSKSNPGSIANEFFDRIGLVLVNNQTNLDNIDKALEIAIECGSNDVREIVLDDEKKYFECDPGQVDQVRANLEVQGLTVDGSTTPFIPKEEVEITPENITLILEMYDRLRDSVDYVENIYDNLASSK